MVFALREICGALATDEAISALQSTQGFPAVMSAAQAVRRTEQIGMRVERDEHSPPR
jgi:hypothetical protein